jgi:hypothetical protein
LQAFEKEVVRRIFGSVSDEEVVNGGSYIMRNLYSYSVSGIVN